VSTNTRYLGVSTLLLGTSWFASAMIARSHGSAAGRRFGIGMSSVLAAQQALVGVAVRFSRRRSPTGREHQLKLVDLMTLTRGLASSLLVGLMVSGVRAAGNGLLAANRCDLPASVSIMKRSTVDSSSLQLCNMLAHGEL